MIFLVIFLFIGLAALLYYLLPLSTTVVPLNFQGQERKYLVHLPRAYNEKHSYPLVVMLHGYSDHPRLMELYSGMSKKADQEGFIVIYPYGTGDKQDPRLSWNATFCCGGAVRTGIDDVGFINAVIKHAQETYSIKHNNIYLAGFSNGAMLAHQVATTYPNTITALGDISGTIGGFSFKPEAPNIPLPVFIAHGVKDQTIPFDDPTNRYLTTQQTVAFWVQNNKAHKVNEEQERYAIKHSYTGTIKRSEVSFFAIPEGKHTWFGGKQELLQNMLQQSFPATDALWEFFKRHAR